MKRTPQRIPRAKIIAMLNLPPKSSNPAIITELVALITALQNKYEQLLSEAVSKEDKLTKIRNLVRKSRQ